MAVGREPFRCRDAVLDIDDPPHLAQRLAVGPAVTGRAAVVDVQDADAAAGEVSLLQVERSRRLRGRSAVHEQDVRRELAGRAVGHRRGGRPAQGVDDAAVRAGEDLRRRRWQPRRTHWQGGTFVDDLVGAGWGDQDDGGGGGGGRADGDDLGAVGVQRGLEGGVRQVEVVQPAVGLQHREAGVAADDAPPVGERRVPG